MTGAVFRHELRADVKNLPASNGQCIADCELII
jgi:hypothetical protein